MAAAGNESASAPRPMRQRPMRRRPMRRLGMAAIGAGLLAPLVAAAPSARVAQVSEERGSRLIDRPNVV